MPADESVAHELRSCRVAVAANKAYWAGVTLGVGLGDAELAAVFLGGPGQAYGAMLGAAAIGLATEVSAAYIQPDYKYVIAFVALLATLAVRPSGLLGART